MARLRGTLAFEGPAGGRDCIEHALLVWYNGSAFAKGELDKDELGGKMMSEGSWWSSSGLGGAVSKFVVTRRSPLWPMFIWENWSARPVTPGS